MSDNLSDPVHRGTQTAQRQYSSTAAQTASGSETASSHPGPGPGQTESSCPKFNLQSAAIILKDLGLAKEDLQELISYPEDQTTPENLPFLLHQIRTRKVKRASTTTQSASQTEPHKYSSSAEPQHLKSEVSKAPSLKPDLQPPPDSQPSCTPVDGTPSGKPGIVVSDSQRPGLTVQMDKWASSKESACPLATPHRSTDTSFSTKPKAAQPSPPTMLKLKGIRHSLSRGDVIASVEVFGKTKSVLLFRSKEQASVCFERVEDAEKLRSLKILDIRGTPVSVVSNEVHPPETPTTTPAKEEQKKPVQLTSISSYPAVAGAEKEDLLSTPSASVNRSEKCEATSETEHLTNAESSAKVSGSSRHPPSRTEETTDTKPQNPPTQLKDSSSTGCPESRTPGPETMDSVEATVEEEPTTEDMQTQPEKKVSPVPMEATTSSKMDSATTAARKRQQPAAAAAAAASWCGEGDMGKYLQAERLECLKSAKWKKKKIMEKLMILLTDLPPYPRFQYTEEDVANLLTPFGFQYLHHHIFVVPQAKMAFAIMPDGYSVLNLLKFSSECGLYLNVHKLHWSVLNFPLYHMPQTYPFVFYRFLLRSMGFKTKKNKTCTVYLDNISPSETWTLRNFLRGHDRVVRFLPLLNKVFVAFQTEADADVLVVWSSFLKKTPRYRMYRQELQKTKGDAPPPRVPPGVVAGNWELKAGVVMPPKVSAVPQGSVSPFWVTSTSSPFAFATVSPWFNIPDYVTIRNLQDLQKVNGFCSTLPTVMLTGLPAGDYVHEDVANLTRPYFTKHTPLWLHYSVTVLPLQRRAFVFFNNWDSCRNFMRDHVGDPVSVGGQQLSVHYVSINMRPGFTERKMYVSLMKWSNAHVPNPDALEKRLLCVTVAQMNPEVFGAVLSGVACIAPFLSFLPLANRLCIEMCDSRGVDQVLKKVRSPFSTNADRLPDFWNLTRSDIEHIESAKILKERLEKSCKAMLKHQLRSHQFARPTGTPAQGVLTTPEAEVSRGAVATTDHKVSESAKSDCGGETSQMPRRLEAGLTEDTPTEVGEAKDEADGEELDNYEILDSIDDEPKEEVDRDENPDRSSEVQMLEPDTEGIAADGGFQVLDTVGDEGPTGPEDDADGQTDASALIWDEGGKDQGATSPPNHQPDGGEGSTAKQPTEEDASHMVARNDMSDSAPDPGGETDRRGDGDVSASVSEEQPSHDGDAPDLQKGGASGEGDVKAIKDEEEEDSVDRHPTSSETDSKRRRTRRQDVTVKKEDVVTRRSSRRTGTSDGEDREMKRDAAAAKRHETLTKDNAEDNVDQVGQAFPDTAETERRMSRGSGEKTDNRTEAAENKDAAGDQDRVATRSTRGRRGPTPKTESSDETPPPTRRKRNTPTETRDEASHQILDSVEEDRPAAAGRRAKRGRLRRSVRTATKEQEEEEAYQVVDSVDEDTPTDEPQSAKRSSFSRTANAEEEEKLTFRIEGEELQTLVSLDEIVKEEDDDREAWLSWLESRPLGPESQSAKPPPSSETVDEAGEEEEQEEEAPPTRRRSRRKSLVGRDTKRLRSQAPGVTGDHRLPPFQSGKPLGLEFVVPKLAFFCQICSTFYLSESAVMNVHCSSKRHYDNLQKHHQKLEEDLQTSAPSGDTSVSD
ncbi:unnamed protein product [Ophioblennius macclurei]